MEDANPENERETEIRINISEDGHDDDGQPREASASFGHVGQVHT